ncbi:MAG: hypothetical protein HQK53_16910 [Oligoflexia bacterium]|nr:hypothetical protein [Oligoflexia bacterium]
MRISFGKFCSFYNYLQIARLLLFLPLFLLSLVVFPFFITQETKAVTNNSFLPPNYDRENPYYIKFCATSRWVPMNPNNAPGVPTGHTVLYLKGACIDQIKNKLPILRLCNPGEKDLVDPESGVGISTDGAFKNTIFFAIPGITPFLSAGVSSHSENTDDEVFNEEVQQRIIKEYTDLGYFDGIELNNEHFTVQENQQYQQLNAAIQASQTEEQQDLALRNRAAFVGKWMLGTDFAIRLSRYSYCINIPLNQGMLAAIIEHLNTENNALATSGGSLPWRNSCPLWNCQNNQGKPSSDYLWDAVYNNCDNTGRNAVAVTGLINANLTDQPILWQLLYYLSIPGTTYLDISRATFVDELDINKIFNNEIQRNAIMKYAWSPIQHQTIGEMIPFYKNNQLYQDTAVTSGTGYPFMIVSNWALVLSKYYPNSEQFCSKHDCNADALIKMAMNQVYGPGPTNLPALLEHYQLFEKKYTQALRQILASKSSDAYTHDKNGDYRYFVNTFESILMAQQLELKNKIDQLN